VSTARRYRHSYAEYLRLEAESPLKLEYSDGEIFAMAGGTPEHGALAMQLVRLVTTALPPTCRIYSSDVKIRVPATNLSTYPDVSIVCGPLERAEDDPNAVTNPRVLVEVTSASTEDYDRGDKLSQYKQIPALEAVFVVSHRRKQVTVVRRDGATWDEREVRGGERVPFVEGVTFAVDDLYSVVDAVG
jgi:Uma2 family endonuclease